MGGSDIKTCEKYNFNHAKKQSWGKIDFMHPTKSCFRWIKELYSPRVNGL